MKLITAAFGLLCFLLLPTNSSAQVESASSEDYEAIVFQKIADSIEIEALDIMIALDYQEGNKEKISQEIEQLYQQLQPEKLKSKSKKKQIKSIYQSIHQAKLKKYIIDADFNQLFEKGEYNCVSATALYALLLDKFTIDYEIRETPTHVYLIADPKGEKVLIETTLPQNGTIKFDYKTQKEFVNYLKSNKLISEEEYNSTPIEKLFDQYYDTNKVINKQQLAALLYYNKGVENFNQSNFSIASDFLAKAYLIYPSSNIHFITNSALINALAKSEGDKKFEPQILAKFANLNKEGSEFAQVGVEHFTLVGNELMVVHPNLNAYQEYYKSFITAVDSSVNTDPYKLEYNNKSAYNFYVNRQYPEALNALGIAYQINKENLQVKDFIFNLSAEHMMADKAHERNLDSLDKYFKLFPFLKEDEPVVAYYNYSKMRVIREKFNYGNLKEGLQRLDAFEAIVKEEQTLLSPNLIDRNYFAEMYMDLASYYFRKENLPKLTQALKRGLEMDPSSSLLQDRYKTIKGVNAQINRSNAAYQTIVENQVESYEDQFNRYFIACWTIDGLLKKGGAEGEHDESFKIMAYDDDEVTYVINGETKKGKYSLRKKAKLLYLIPNADKEDYTIFKLVNVNRTEMVLMPFKNDKLTGERIYMVKC